MSRAKQHASSHLLPTQQQLAIGVFPPFPQVILLVKWSPTQLWRLLWGESLAHRSLRAQWALQGALEEESGSPCAIGRREKGEDMPTGLMGVNP